ncbi:predicted coding region AF_1809 [Archaeoglobus fulgidus DSM 4304]|uniref:Uncharacterized protein AF_1809 n=1 Tax=Archaeoglobus fulgidus (strain ATCC 49558 / DSM 4304 / JCM 9628 / NBRC 100126 / VC-16) TaxID=224325 RepID=Y1809_ARCFU|nr:RecName: Full=Uncharacterized protein AF_1809 [Archaeoglobus fulgidus DSM 4304]AAB89452.1 predicted coding region AF_1809 [Archaeoglobus fulgidus DSM 4304]
MKSAFLVLLPLPSSTLQKMQLRLQPVMFLTCRRFAPLSIIPKAECPSKGIPLSLVTNTSSLPVTLFRTLFSSAKETMYSFEYLFSSLL